MALPRRKTRRLTLVRLSTCLMFVSPFVAAVWSRSAIAAVTLQHLDAIAVGVLHEEEFCHQRAVAMEFADRVRRQFLAAKRACSAARSFTTNAIWP